MANQEHIDILKKGMQEWDSWRRQNLAVVPDLSGADLSKMILWRGNFYRVNFKDAILQQTDFQFSDLSCSQFSNADLQNAGLCRTNLQQSIFNDANFKGAILGGTVFGSTDLNRAKWLETIIHLGESHLDFETLRISGRLPIKLLRACNWPGKLIFESEGVFSENNEEPRYSCFISYSSTDNDFAENLYKHLIKEQVLCWFAPHDLKIGDRIRDSIEYAIKRQEKLLLILSKNSIVSDWVESEVEAAFEKERNTAELVLFPISIDREFMNSEKGWVANLRRTRNAGDFRDWTQSDNFKTAFGRLLRDIRIST